MEEVDEAADVEEDPAAGLLFLPGIDFTIDLLAPLLLRGWAAAAPFWPLLLMLLLGLLLLLLTLLLLP